jgi:hypothetical protein
VTYGLTDRLDVSLAVPLVRTQLSAASDATIQRIGTGTNLKIHFFYDPSAPGGYGSEKQFSASGSASGLGDLVLRIKGTAIKRGPAGLALGLDVRMPTGDERDLLGSGAVGLKPFAAMSFGIKRVSPHVNVGYQWNGASLLAGNITTDQKANLPHQLLYIAGADVGVSERLTLALDFLGQELFNSPRLFRTSFTVTNGTLSETFPDIGFRKDTYNIASGSAGFKTNIAGRLLANFNLLFKLNDNGLRSKVTPLVGIEYSF